MLVGAAICVAVAAFAFIVARIILRQQKGVTAIALFRAVGHRKQLLLG
jgi:hypothetical protein